jgi:short-subunit dehydrogenase
MEETFAGRRVLVTGAGKGISSFSLFIIYLYYLSSTGLGYAIVKNFYEKGSIVFALDKNREALQALKKEFRNVTLICVDLEDSVETRRKVKSISPIHHLVNAQTGYFQEIALEQIDE